MNPEATIGIPTFRRLDCLKEAVDSALRQKFTSFEVLVSNDGDSQEIDAWCREVAARNQRVIYRRNQRNLGLAGNWNAVARAARGRWTVIIGDDDRLLPDFLSTLVPIAREGFDVVFSNHHVIDSEGARLPDETLRWARKYRRNELPLGRIENPKNWIWRNAVPMSSSLIKTSALVDLRFAEDLNTPEIEFFLRLAGQSGSFWFVPEYLVEFRVHPASATSSGLWNDRLARRLLELPADPQFEADKRAFMTPLIIDAVSRSLRFADAQSARFFRECAYYPRHWWRKPATIFQTIACSVPPTLGIPLYRFAWRFRRGRH